MKKISLLVAFLWLGIMGASAQPKDNCDVNGDGVVNILDVIYVVDHVLGNHEPQAVDLGLPSMTKWASFNVGASKPEEYGDFYAWGEMEVKEEYNQSTYKYYQNGSYVNIGSDICNTDYDMAHVKWGGKWRMPTMYDVWELISECTTEWTTLNGVKGMKFTSKQNGNSIFLPCSGEIMNIYNSAKGVDGYIWTSTAYNRDGYAYSLYFGSTSANPKIVTCEPNYSHVGIPVRPVMKEW